MRNEEKAVIGVDKKKEKTIETKQNLAISGAGTPRRRARGTTSEVANGINKTGHPPKGAPCSAILVVKGIIMIDSTRRKWPTAWAVLKGKQISQAKLTVLNGLRMFRRFSRNAL
uniref:(northern house mosquito) hypothetical protein n=1 Tax=Culex pipiens TaxID=7175 RepID=A0A8D8NVW0_CULPI